MPTGRGASCQYVFIDKTGRAVAGERYDSAQDYSDGLAAVRIGEKWGYVDHGGKWVMRPRFVSASTGFSHGLAHVALELGKDGTGEFSWIDTAGRTVFAYQVR